MIIRSSVELRRPSICPKILSNTSLYDLVHSIFGYTASFLNTWQTGKDSYEHSSYHEFNKLLLLLAAALGVGDVSISAKALNLQAWLLCFYRVLAEVSALLEMLRRENCSHTKVDPASDGLVL